MIGRRSNARTIAVRHDRRDPGSRRSSRTTRTETFSQPLFPRLGLVANPDVWNPVLRDTTS